MATPAHHEKDKLFAGLPETQTPDRPPVPPASLPVEPVSGGPRVETAPATPTIPEVAATPIAVEVPRQSDAELEQPTPLQTETTPTATADRPGWLRRLFRRRRSRTAATTTTPSIKTQDRQAIESVLSEGLTDMYQKMTPQQQVRFQAAGKVAAATIETLLSNFRATARKVAALIRHWLALIPGVSRYFLAQESKLKTDKILQLQRQRKQQERLKKLRIQ